MKNLYNPTWIRLPDLVPNVHYSHDRMKHFIWKVGLKPKNSNME